jgi:tryptophanyl-tRNA synthetase
MGDPAHIDTILIKGAARAEAIAAKNMKAVKNILGFVQP